VNDKHMLEAAAGLSAEDIDYIRRRCGKPVRPPTKAQEKVSAEPPIAEEAAPAAESEETPPPAETLQHKPQSVSNEVSKQKTQKTSRPNRPTRRHIEHEWPEVGTILHADYFGEHYTAEVIAAPPERNLKSGKMIKLTSGPASGFVHTSMSRAMEAATAKQREDQNLGRKGCLSGWEFWKWEDAKT